MNATVTLELAEYLRILDKVKAKENELAQISLALGYVYKTNIENLLREGSAIKDEIKRNDLRRRLKEGTL